MTDQPSPTDVREQLDQILDRARNDPDFGERLNEDPSGTLREAGLQEAAIGEAAQEIEGFNSMMPQMRCTATCDFRTCLATGCDNWHTFATNNT